ncbi:MULTISPECIES: hypothetical protein [Paenibacillus]|uniref:Uncharacterized protein n=1 Tax=Paenibacillus lignilyticus TaxID=1172615 RepID=A0ABS5CMV4_9BACL|nr:MULTISPECIES: hypothetical protein [Paenibacillus]MBP3967191.1 hypothetical protein [Paenibacillus lignilyticus]SFS61672.1 hypothetical protein SAMN05428962_1507 [Paenibacillus sp. BC26]
MEERKLELVRKLSQIGIQKDPQWVDRLDEPAPLWVVLELIVEMMERRDSPHQPFD